MLMLFVSFFNESFVLEDLKVERAPDNGHKQKAEHSSDCYDPDARPFFPFVFHLT
jgi:hypothetical protein